MSVINAVAQLLGGEGYQISRSVRLRSAATAYFNRTPSGAGNRTTWTWSGWVKRGSLGTTQAIFGSSTSGTSPNFEFRFSTSDTLDIYDNSGTIQWRLTTSQVFRDPSAWYHIVFTFDSTNATSANRAKLYVNGSQITSFSTATYPSSSYASYWNSALAAGIGLSVGDQFDGYLTEVNFIDGQALTPSAFGQNDPVTGVWGAKKYAGTYGTNGFYLNFSDPSAATAAAIGKDSSGNGNNWTPNNVSVTAGVTYDSMLDVPTMWADGGNGRGNYAVLNPLNKNASSITVLDGNLGISTSASNVGVAGTIGVSSGKWYWEVTFTNASGTPSIGVAPATWDKTYVGSGSGGGVGYHANAVIYNNGSLAQSGLASYTSGDVIGIALDMGAGSVTFYKNNVQQGTTVTGLTGDWFPAVAGQTSSTLSANFGQRPFAYTPPTGFKALNTQNLPDGTIKAGNKYFDATIYTGSGSPQTVTNTGGFAPDLAWVKSRSLGTGHLVADTVRGAGLSLFTQATAAEDTNDANGYISAFNSNGFTTTAGSTNGTNVNSSGATYVGWQWKKGATQGFDIVTQTTTSSGAQTFAHSLGVSPKLIILKSRSNASGPWWTYHASVPSGYLLLNTTAALTTSGNFQSVSSTNFVMSSGFADSSPYVAYLFSEVAGFSKFGSYTGNGSADGPFVYCGFRPRFIMWKRTDTAGASWNMYDTSRSTYNSSTADLFANLSNAESTQAVINIISNGWKIRDAGGAEINASGGTYIYAAFAENPFKNSLAR